MYPTEGEQADRVRETYVARNPKHETSKAIIEAIAAEEGITTAKVRHILAVGGPGYVRWTKADVVNTAAEGQKVREAFAEFADTPRDAQFLRTRATFLSKVSDEQYLTVKAVTKYAKANGF